MGKNKKEKKGKGAEKTQRKTEARVGKKQQRALDAAGEENVEALIAQFQAQDKRRTEVHEVVCAAPSPRSSFSFTAHADRSEVLLFGGELFDGSKTYVYNDLFVLRVPDGKSAAEGDVEAAVEWRQVTSPCQPPPRCSHQAVLLASGAGGSQELWLFGGEFSSPSQSQFYHYADLWKLAVRARRWEQLSPSGAQPAARSGHRMLACRGQLLLFGGFVDTGARCRYLQDLWQFSTTTGQWTQLLAAKGAPWPAPRSACLAMPLAGAFRAGGGAPCVLLQGGYVKEQVRKEVERGRVHVDAWTLQLIADADGSVGARWTAVKPSGNRPSPRTGASLAALAGGGGGAPGRGYVFGGVFDRTETDEDVEGVFFDELHSLDLERMRWHEVEYRGFGATAGSDERRRPRRRKDKLMAGVEDGADSAAEDDAAEDMETDAVVDEVDKLQLAAVPDAVFTVSVPDEAAEVMGATAAAPRRHSAPPSARMNAGLAVLGDTLLLYGGVCEQAERQITCDDLHLLELSRLEGWRCLQPGSMAGQRWLGADSSASEDELEPEQAAAPASDEDSDEESDDELDAPALEDGESAALYFGRTRDFWLDYVRSELAEEGLSVSERRLLKYARNSCNAAHAKLAAD